MENEHYLEVSDGIIEKGEQIYYNYFKPDYENQNIKDSKDYKKWFKIMKDKSKNDVLCRCPFDKIYFINNKICPLCKRKICNYCSKVIPTSSAYYIKRRLKNNHEKGLEIMNRKSRINILMTVILQK